MQLEPSMICLEVWPNHLEHMGLGQYPQYIYIHHYIMYIYILYNTIVYTTMHICIVMYIYIFYIHIHTRHFGIAQFWGNPLEHFWTPQFHHPAVPSHYRAAKPL